MARSLAGGHRCAISNTVQACRVLARTPYTERSWRTMQRRVLLATILACLLLGKGSSMLRPVMWSCFVALFVGAMAGSAPAAPEKRVALVIGNAAYTNITALKKPINDARRVAEVLRGLGYEVILGTDASKLQLESLAQRFRAAVRGAEVGFFYYSGHGFQTNRLDQPHPVNHIVPVDFNVQEADTTLATLPLDIIMETLKREARVGFIFMDACRNDPLLAAASDRTAHGTRGVTMARGFSPVSVFGEKPVVAKHKQEGRKSPAGLLIAYATDPGNVALEGEKGLLSPFTSALVKHMATPGLSIAEAMGLVSAEVSSDTQGQQTPWNVWSLTAGMYQFLPKPVQSPKALTAPSGPRGPTAKSSELAAQLKWRCRSWIVGQDLFLSSKTVGGHAAAGLFPRGNECPGACKPRFASGADRQQYGTIKFMHEV